MRIRVAQETRSTTGLEIRQVFDGRLALMPYYPIGYPDLETSLSIIQRLCASGADIVELGVPFSDPLADGPTIQAATQKALAGGVTIRTCLEAAGELRRRGITQPLVLMSYYNPILQFGVPKFTAQCARSGVSGLIIPDLPPEEAGQLVNSSRENGLDTIFLLTPNSTEERMRIASEQATGFVYLVSLTGITGARDTLTRGLEDFARRVRRHTDLPLAVGFGISTAEHVASVGRFAEGVIVGSALVDRVRLAVEAGQDPADAAGAYIGYLGAGRPTA